MTELVIIWLVVAYRTRKFRQAIRDRLRPRKPRVPAAHRPLSRRQAKAALALSTWNRELADTPSDAFPVVAAVDPDIAEWDDQLGVAVDRYAFEVAPIAAELADLEPSGVVEFDGEKVSIDELCSFTLAWRRIPGGGLERVDVYAGASA